MGTVPHRSQRWLRHNSMGSQTAVVEWQSRYTRRLVPRSRAMARGQLAAAEFGSDVSGASFDQHLPKLDHAQRRLAAVVQLRLGRGAHAQSNYAAAVLAHGKLCA